MKFDRLRFSTESYGYTAVLWEALLDELGLSYRTSDSWQAQSPKQPDPILGEVLYWYESRGMASPYVEIITRRPDGSAAHLTFTRGTFTANIAANTQQKALDYMQEIEHLYPKVEPSEKGLSVTFWSDGNGQGGRCFFRTLAAPSWDDIAANYPQETREKLDALMKARFNAESSGKLILWQGMPGTGKTFALRALAQSWKPWAKLHYILDPERFFGSEATYMMSVILGEGGSIPSHIAAALDDDDVDDDDDDKGPISDAQKWRLVVLEDTGELLTQDAKQNTGQALSRLLNVCDGLIGQGLKVLVLITTNEDISTMHSAVMRPGRLASKSVFKPMDSIESVEWLKTHGKTDISIGQGQRSLAELYAILAGEDMAPQRKEAGFAGFR